MKTDFLSRVAHDLRTPLASISWSTANLIDGVAGPISPPQKEYLGSIRTSAAHLNRMVTNLLEISRMELASETLELEPVDLRLVLEETVTAIRPLAEEKRVSLRIKADDDSLRAMGHRGKLLEVALNLVDNAIEYSPPDSAIIIHAHRVDDGHVGFSVRDHGPGFDLQIQKKLFHRFQQAAESPYGSRHGFGLGLFIVKSYMDLMKGTVTARNHPEGGAVFSCTLPAPPPEKGTDP
jgi:signal transduction histidine kinase